MIAFIVFNLLLATLALNQNEFLPLLATPAGLGLGLTALASSLLAGYYKKLPSLIWHDGFASSALLVWYSYWQPQFDEGTPMFFVFPLYYALLTSFVTLALINKSRDFDVDSVRYLRQLEKLARIDLRLSIILVLLSLLITRHYALYPMAMTYFIIRHTMTVCLEKIDS